MATRLLLNGSEFQVNEDVGGLGNGVDGNQSAPDATALIDGRFAVTYQSDHFGNSTDPNPIVSVLSVGFLDVYNNAGHQTQPVIAGRLDAGFGVVFTNDLHANSGADANGPNITYRPASAGGALGTALAIGDFDGGLGHDALSNPDIATLSTGLQVVVFERTFSGSDHDIYLNVVNAAGTGTLFTPAVPLTVSANNSYQAHPSVAANGNQALVAYEDATGTTIGNTNIVARLYDGATISLGAAFTIADHSLGLVSSSVAALPDNRYVIVYTDPNDIFGRIWDPLTPGGVFLSDEFQIDNPGGSAFNPAVAATADGGFIVVWNDFIGGASVYDVQVHRFDAHGVSYGDIFTVNTLTDMSQFDPTIATSGSNVVIAWQDFAAHATDPDPTGVRAQLFTTAAFDYDSAGIGDLDGNGRVDILFQNDTGNVAVWQTNGNGAVFSINSLGQRPAGYLIDGTGNFNATPGDDILLRSSGGTLAIWPTAGIAVGAPVVVGNAPNTYHNAGIGDFTGDGSDDLLFRNDAGEIVTWAIANNGLAAAPKVLGSTALVYHIVGIDDFTGDHQADILFRHDNGGIALWQVANNELLSAQLIGSTSSAYHVVSTGDFDGNGAKDILFRGRQRRAGGMATRLDWWAPDVAHVDRHRRGQLPRRRHRRPQRRRPRRHHLPRRRRHAGGMADERHVARGSARRDGICRRRLRHCSPSFRHRLRLLVGTS
jgi:hypothetical protein